MTGNQEPPKLRYALSDATCCGAGLDKHDGEGGEFLGMADTNLLQRMHENEKRWGFTEDYDLEPEHGMGHEILINAASIFPQTGEMQRIMTAPRYQGDMQYEFFVIGVQNVTREVRNELRSGEVDHVSKQEIQQRIKDRIESNYTSTKNKTIGELGQKGAFLISKLSGGKKSPFEVRQEHGFHDMRIFDRASGAANFGGEPMDWQAQMKDGDNFTSEDGTTYYFETMKQPDLEDQTWPDLISRASTFIHHNQDALAQSETITDFMKDTTEGQLYATMLLDETADPQNRNTYYEDIIGFDMQRHGVNAQKSSETKYSDLTV